MREGRTARRVETVGSRQAERPRPQWQGLFLAPEYRGDIADAIEADWEQEQLRERSVPAARRRGHNGHHRAA